jgi:murein DD-endopeptidase MepM/ murein hydrolase activator NlpD
MAVLVEVTALPSPVPIARKGGHRRCARCAKVVSRRALVCRRCGKKQRINPRSALLAVASVFLIGLFAVATAAQLPSWRTPRAGDRTSVVVEAREPAEGTLTASQLWSLYNLDAARADARFKNRTVAITGRVREVRRDYRGNLLLRLATDSPFENVRASVVSREDSGRAVPVPGQVVSLRCLGRGAAIGAPVLDSCVAL